MTPHGRVIRLLALGAGVALLLAMIVEAGPSRLAAEALGIGPAFLLIVPVSFSWFALNAWGWRLALQAQGAGAVPGLWPLVRAYLAAEAVNNITPFMAVGGEPLKVALLASRVAPERTVASVIGDNVVHALTAPLFMLGGLALGCVAFELERGLVLQLIAATAIIGLPAAVAWIATGRGVAGPLVRLAASRIGGADRGAWSAKAGRVDALTSAFLGAGGWRFWAAIALHMAGRTMGAVEAWIILEALGVPVSVAGAMFVIAVAHVAVNIVFSIIPSQVGVQEAAAYVVFAAVGLDPASAVTLMLVRRVRGFIWIAAGLGLAARPPASPARGAGFARPGGPEGPPYVPGAAAPGC